MEFHQHLLTLIKQPGLMRRMTPVFLLSHMRANTSLFGHILGSNPEICGYYEMHIGYYNWKSLWRQRLLFFRNHSSKPDMHFMFDKILHDYHHFSPNVANQLGGQVLISLRDPRQTIKSIVTLFREQGITHEMTDIRAAADYYCTRVTSLGAIAREIDHYFYFDAEQLRSDNSDTLLADISHWLKLSQPLDSNFSHFTFSNKQKAGDTSGKLSLGKIDKKRSDYSHLSIPPDLLERAQSVYESNRKQLMAGSVNYSIKQ